MNQTAEADNFPTHQIADVYDDTTHIFTITVNWNSAVGDYQSNLNLYYKVPTGSAYSGPSDCAQLQNDPSTIYFDNYGSDPDYFGWNHQPGDPSAAIVSNGWYWPDNATVDARMGGTNGARRSWASNGYESGAEFIVNSSGPSITTGKTYKVTTISTNPIGPNPNYYLILVDNSNHKTLSISSSDTNFKSTDTGNLVWTSTINAPAGANASAMKLIWQGINKANVVPFDSFPSGNDSPLSSIQILCIGFS